MSKLHKLLTASALALSALSTPAISEPLGLGRDALPDEITAWDVAVLPDGTGLPEGSGDAITGDEIFADKCATCHGDFAEGIDNWPVLAGGQGTLTNVRPVKTVGSYWPYLSTVWDYVHRSMPFGSAQTVTPDEVYAITAFILYSNGVVEEDFVLSRDNFAEIALPNADGFYPDDRADVEYTLFSTDPCMQDCMAPVKVTKRAVDLNVTPEDPDGKPAGTLPNIQVTQAEAGAPEVEAEAEMAAGEADPALVEAGEGVFKKCKACHKVGENAKNGAGPMLNGIFGRAAGTVEGFRYSKPMVDAGTGGLMWDDETLSAFLADPRKYIPKTKMSFAGLKDEEDRAAIVAYLKTFGP
jgi:cytochrome c